MKHIHRPKVQFIGLGMALAFLFGLIALPGTVGLARSATLLPSLATGHIVEVLGPTHSHLPQPGGLGGFESRCGGGCVLDRSTGYIWESAPMPTPQTASQAQSHCKSLNSQYPPKNLTSNANAIGRGWDIPFIREFATLPDPTLPSSNVSPNIFFNVQKSLYWTSSADPGRQLSLARLFGAPFGGVGLVQPQSVNLLVWCMLGPSEVCGVSSAYPCIIHAE